MAAMLRTAGRPSHWTEEIIAQELSSALPDDWIVVRSASFIDSKGSSHDLDVTVIGPPGVVLIEVKSWLGKIECRAGAPWLRNCTSESSWTEFPNPVSSIITKQERFHSHLFEKRGLSHASVFGVVAFHGRDFELLGAKEVRRNAYPAAKLAKLILERRLVHRIHNIRQLTMSESQTIADLLRAPSSGIPYVQGYEIRKAVEWNDGTGNVIFPAVEIISGEERRIVFTPGLLDAAEGGTARREAVALSLINNPQVVRYFHAFRDVDYDDALVTVTEPLPSACLADYLPPQGPLDSQTSREWLRLAFVGLEACHARGVIHRKISPSSIRVVGNRGPVIADFDMARVPNVPTIVDRAIVRDRFVAPELASSTSAASPGSDLFSMAAVFSALAGAPQDGGASEETALKRAYGDRAGQVLSRCLSAVPAGRPSAARELLAAL